MANSESSEHITKIRRPNDQKYFQKSPTVSTSQSCSLLSPFSYPLINMPKSPKIMKKRPKPLMFNPDKDYMKVHELSPYNRYARNIISTKVSMKNSKASKSVIYHEIQPTSVQKSASNCHSSSSGVPKYNLPDLKSFILDMVKQKNLPPLPKRPMKNFDTE